MCHSVKKYENLLKVIITCLNFIKKLFLNFKLFNFLTMFLVLCITLSNYLWDFINQNNCLIEMPHDIRQMFRPAEICDFCSGVKKIVRASNISPEEFESIFAYTGVPVIITDATTNWTALQVFNYWYFKDIYSNVKGKRKILSCQFFPYKSGLRNLFDALHMPEDRVSFKKGTKPWYFGWSNCNNEVAEILRQHYDRPYFLPELSENAAVDWIFMGGSGLGAQLHIDNVRLPSWQAQISGSKEWILVPPPECFFKCDSLKAIVNKGDINTNRWYHQTKILSGDVSITIGAEFD